MDTWLDAVRNLRNYCAHPSMVVGMTSSVVIPDNRDSADVLPDNTNLYSRLYALKKILPQKDADMLAEELEKLISKTKVDIYIYIYIGGEAAKRIGSLETRVRTFSWTI